LFSGEAASVPIRAAVGKSAADVRFLAQTSFLWDDTPESTGLRP